MDNIKELEKLENAAKNIQDNSTCEEKINQVDGWVRLDKSKMPRKGILYPENWQFAYRCPTAKEVSNFSTINEGDQQAVISIIEDLIKKCVKIIDVENGKEVSSNNINDGDRTFFLLLLREFYLPNSPMEFPTMCMNCKSSVVVNFSSSNLVYSELTDKLLDCFDGRVFTLNIKNDKIIKIHIPTLNITGKIYRYIVKTYREAQQEKDNKSDSVAFDKAFLTLSPLLFETGTESIPEIKNKFKKIQEDPLLLQAYSLLLNKLKFENSEVINFIHKDCGSEEETQIKFPGGFKNLFIDNTLFEGLF